MPDLNEEQRRAVESQAARTLVVAGAGTGKTTALAHRAAYLIEHDVSASTILAMSYTRKASAEMAQRIADLVGIGAASQIWMGTIHSICYRVISQWLPRADYEDAPTVYGPSEADSVKEGVISDLRLRFSVRQFNEALKRGTADTALRRGLDEYRRRLKVAGATDYDGLVTDALAILEEPDVKAHYRSQFSYLLVDEAQDLAESTWRVVDALAGGSVWAVGDDSQSIFRFLGASIDRFLGCAEQGWAVFPLTRNYRCTKPILALGNAVLERNTRRIPKTLITEKDGPAVEAHGFPDDGAEMQWVASEIRALADEPLQAGPPAAEEETLPDKAPAWKWNQIAVLCRTNPFVERVVEALTLAEIPVQAVGGLDPFATQTGRLVIDLFRLAVNPHDDMTVSRVLIGAGTSPQRIAIAQKRRLDEGMILFDAARTLPPNDPGRRCLEAAQAVILPMANQPKAAVRFVVESIRRIPQLSGLGDSIMAVPIFNAMDDWSMRGGGSLSDFLLFTATKSAIDLWDEGQDAVAVMTVHAAKGLEFPIVFVPGWEEGMLPHYLSKSKPEDLEEERRIAHVAVTRAAERLYVSWAEERAEFSQIWRRQRSHLLESLCLQTT